MVELADSAGVEVATVTELPPLDDPAFEWRHDVVRAVRGSGEDPADEPPFYNPGQFIHLEDGTLVVTDRGEYRLVVIGPDGSVLRRFARRGRGPGEISGSSPALWLGPDGSIMVADLANRRISSFTLEGELTRMVSMRVPPGRYVFESTARPGAPELYVALRSGRVPRPGEPATSGDSVARVDAASGEVAPLAPLPDTPPLPPGGRPGRVMFQPRSVWTVLGSGLIVTGRTDRGTFRVYGRDGVLVREIRLPLAARPVRDADRAEIVALWQGATGTSGFAARDPVIYPEYDVFNRLAAFDDTTFALQHARWSRAAGDPEIPEGQSVWRLVTVSGGYAGAVRFPTGFYPHEVRNGRALGVQRDSLDVADVVELRLEPPEGMPRSLFRTAATR
ncbi:MAG TPA: hypothetical protein VF192_11885 [Longimicrobiales bacterium]